jgi:hypothetical protein
VIAGNWSCHLCIEEFHGGKKPEGMQWSAQWSSAQPF